MSLRCLFRHPFRLRDSDGLCAPCRYGLRRAMAAHPATPMQDATALGLPLHAMASDPALDARLRSALNTLDQP